MYIAIFIDARHVWSVLLPPKSSLETPRPPILVGPESVLLRPTSIYPCKNPWPCPCIYPGGIHWLIHGYIHGCINGRIQMVLRRLHIVFLKVTCSCIWPKWPASDLLLVPRRGPAKPPRVFSYSSKKWPAIERVFRQVTFLYKYHGRNEKRNHWTRKISIRHSKQNNDFPKEDLKRLITNTMTTIEKMI